MTILGVNDVCKIHTYCVTLFIIYRHMTCVIGICATYLAYP